MTTYQNTFEGGTPGTAVTTGNSGGTSGDPLDFVDPSSSTIAYTDDALHGSVACEVSTTEDDDPYYAWQTGVAGTTTWGRVYIKIASYPSGNTNIVRHLADLQIVITVRIGSNGRLGLLYGTGTFAANGTVEVPLNTWVRLEWAVTTGVGTGSVTAWLYTDRESETPADTLQAVGVNVGTADAVTRQRMGILSSETWSILFDTVAFSDTAKIGPYAAGGPTVRDAADGLVLTDTASRGLVAARPAGDALGVGDTGSRAAAVVRAAADGTVVGDIAAPSQTAARAAADGTMLGDAASAHVILARDITDGAALSDSAARTVAQARAAVDAVTTVDAAAGSAARAVTAADTAGLGDAAARRLVLGRAGGDFTIPGDGSNSDFLHFARTAAAGVAVARGGVDGLTVADAVAVTSGQTVTAVDGLTAADAAARSTTAARNVVDGVAVADEAAGASGQTVTAGDAVTVADAAARSLALGRAVPGVLVLTGTVASATTTGRAAAGMLGLADTATRAAGKTLTAGDAFTVGDAAGRALLHTRAGAELFALVDTAGRTGVGSSNATDHLVLAHTVTRTGGEPPPARGTVTLTSLSAGTTVSSYGSEVVVA